MTARAAECPGAARPCRGRPAQRLLPLPELPELPELLSLLLPLLLLPGAPLPLPLLGLVLPPVEESLELGEPPMAPRLRELGVPEFIWVESVDEAGLAPMELERELPMEVSLAHAASSAAAAHRPAAAEPRRMEDADMGGLLSW